MRQNNFRREQEFAGNILSFQLETRDLSILSDKVTPRQPPISFGEILYM